MLFRNPIRWAATRVLRNHILDSWKPGKYFSDSPKSSSSKSRTAEVFSGSSTNENAPAYSDFVSHSNFQEGHRNILLKYFLADDPIRLVVSHSALDQIEDRLWPQESIAKWFTTGGLDGSLAAQYNIQIRSLAYILALAHAKYGEQPKLGSVTISYSPDTTVFRVDEYGITHRVSDFYGDTLDAAVSRKILPS